MERSLVLIKPDALDRGIVGEIIKRFERAGIKIVAIEDGRGDSEQRRR